MLQGLWNDRLDVTMPKFSSEVAEASAAQLAELVDQIKGDAARTEIMLMLLQ